MMRTCPFLVCAWLASGLQQPRETSREAVCDEFAWQSAEALIRARQYEDAKGNPCLSDERLDGLIRGREDPADIDEFLGASASSTEAGTFATKLSENELLPQVMLLAIPHSGSTSLAQQLNMHPELSYGRMKEHNMIWNVAGPKKQEWLRRYRSTFLAANDTVKYTFDASPALFFVGNNDDLVMGRYSAGTGVDGVRNIKSVLGGNVKFVVMLRNPLDWIFSLMENNPNGIASMDRLLSNISVYGTRACYADVLANWLEVYSSEHFLYIASEDYFAHPQQTLDRVFNFVGVSPRTYRQEELTAQGRRRNTRHPSVHTSNSYFKSDRMKRCLNSLARLTKNYYHWP